MTHKKLKYLCRIVGGGTPSKAREDFWKGDIPWVSPKDMKAFRISDAQDHITPATVADSATRIVPSQSVLVVVRSGILQHSIPVAINRVPVALNQDMKALIPSAALQPDFLAYFIAGSQQRLLSEWRKEGTTVESIEVPDLANTQCPVPSRERQAEVVGLLERQTAKIDDLIAKKERLQSLLDAVRLTVISDAVRGESAARPLLPWPAVRLRFLLRRIEQGWSPQCETRPAGPDEWGVMKAGCVNGIKFNEDENKVLPPSVEPETRFEIKAGDVLVSRANTRELLGSAALVREVRPRLLLCDKLYRLSCRPSLNPEFLVYFLRSFQGRFQIEREATGTSGSMQNVGQDTLQNLVVALPSEAEQAATCRHIRARTCAIDDACSRIHAAISLLREYRAALISAAVTGQLDVREHEKQLEALA